MTNLSKWVSFFALLLPLAVSAETPFNKGVNLTNWFQSSSARQIQFSKFSKTDFEHIKSLGCDVIRLPINLHGMTGPGPDHALDPLFFTLLDQAVDWAEALNLKLILDNHSFDPAGSTDPAIGDLLNKVWTQMAQHYKNRSDLVFYEILNEPHGIDPSLWNAIQQAAINAIRTEDTSHFIVVGGANYNNYNELAGLPHYTDNKLIYTFHFYDPFIFTHQGASWTDPSMVPLSGVPFPYQSSAMPAVPASLKGTWIEDQMKNYNSDGTAAKVKQLIDIAVNFKTQRGVPVYCGEFGVYIPNSDNTQRTAWYTLVRSYLEEKGIPWTIWDYTGGFGLFEKNSNELFDYDLNVPLLQGLGLTVPPGQIYTPHFQQTGLIIYDDYIGPGLLESSSSGTGTLDFYQPANVHAGNFSIYWSGVDQYFTIGFDFKPDGNFSLLPDYDFTLDFWVKGDTPGASFDVRFLDTKTGADDHPWRLGKTIDNTYASWDNEWHHIIIPLSELEEKGSWDNEYINPQGKFDWSATDKFEIVAEQQALNGMGFYFDDINISGEPFVVTSVLKTEESSAVNIFPNPARDELHVEYTLMHPGNTVISLYSAIGQEIRTIDNGNVVPGKHDVKLDVGDLPGGIYLVRIASEEVQLTKKVRVE